MTQVALCSFTDEKAETYVDGVTCLILYGRQDHGYLTLKPLIISFSNPFSKWDLLAGLEVKSFESCLHTVHFNLGKKKKPVKRKRQYLENTLPKSGQPKTVSSSGGQGPRPP